MISVGPTVAQKSVSVFRWSSNCKTLIHMNDARPHRVCLDLCTLCHEVFASVGRLSA